MSSGTVTVDPFGSAANKSKAPRGQRLLRALDEQILRHQRAISLTTAVLAVLGAGAMVVGLTRLSPAVRALAPF